MSESERARPAPDQNDPTGRSRPGSPTYHPGNPPSNNMKPSARPQRVSSEDEPEDPPKTGTREQQEGSTPNVPTPMTQQGAPD